MGLKDRGYCQQEKEGEAVKFRWTIKELQEVTNKKLIHTLITEREFGLHPYSPLRKRLGKLRRFIEAKEDNYFEGDIS